MLRYRKRQLRKKRRTLSYDIVVLGNKISKLNPDDIKEVINLIFKIILLVLKVQIILQWLSEIFPNVYQLYPKAQTHNLLISHEEYLKNGQD